MQWLRVPATISDLAGSGNDTVPASAMSLNGLAALDANTPIVLHDTAVLPIVMAIRSI